LKKYITKLPLLAFLIKKLLFICRKFISRLKWNKIKRSSEIKLELGSGNKKGINGWTTVDNKSADIDWDLRFGIPLPDNCVDKIYSSHLLEHIPYNELLKFLSECHRVMKIDGEFSVCVPNFRLYINAYIDGRIFKQRREWYQPALINTNSVIDQLNYMMYMNGQHKYMFDEENLINTLLTAGFKKVNLREFDSMIDLSERDYESIYAVARKGNS
jgi:predicted SAM-dependent methyltransferase